ncbi:L-idonate 5-dehydrogenase [Chromatiales bacterium (ex Bugula neritina AB1)]|nr:L-idonate 5-dehydrogenase [Chromatiales bacterium (ex Bugula neritina AB1)]
MRAIVAHAAKDLRIEERQRREPGDDEVVVQVERGGICGSDLHYFNHGGFGTVKLREPMILGHEIAGSIIESRSGLLAPGQRVAVSPSRPCRNCNYCLEGKPNHCMNMRFYGSAMPFPHIQGAFREQLTVRADQCAPADDLSIGEAAMAEPLAVTVHAARQAGNLVGKRVLVTGCGPIGLLCILVARSSGAVEVVATDIADFPLQTAGAIGADTAVNAAEEGALDTWYKGKGHFDVHFECTGVASALASAIPALRPGGTIVQLGLGGDMTLPVQQMTAKELQLRGSFRFHEEFFTGNNWMRNGQIDVKPLITHTLALNNAIEAFELASDRSQALKVQLAFN